jgi:hypothetical protein
VRFTKTKFFSFFTSIFNQNSSSPGVLTAPNAIKKIVLILGLGAVALIAGCASRSRPAPSTAPVPVPSPAPVFTPQPAPPAASASRLPLVASWADYRRRAAQMILASNPGASFEGPQPAQWSGIATVTVMLNADGSVRGMDLMRGSRISPQVNDLALVAARRAANYGPVSNLPQPWQFNETFLYNDSNKFQLVTIVEGR